MNHIESILNANTDSRLPYADTIQKMQAYINSDKNKGELLSPTHYVVRFILGGIENAETLAKKVVAAKIVSWERNGGLKIPAMYSEFKRTYLLDEYPMSEQGMAKMFEKALALHEEKNSVKAPSANLQFLNNMESKTDNKNNLTQKNHTSCSFSKCVIN